MKKYSLIKIIFVLCVAVSTSFSLPKGIIYTEPLLLSQGILNASFEKMLTNKHSLIGGAVVWNYDSSEWKWNAYELLGAYRTYFNPATAPAGMWWSLNVSVAYMTIEHTTIDYYWSGNDLIYYEKKVSGSGTIVTPGASIGYNYVFSKNFVVSGSAYISQPLAKIKIDNEEVPYSTYTFGFSFSIGFIF